jgi:hypothetical protein
VSKGIDTDGAQFAIGKAGSITIDALILFNNGIQLDTHAGTTESRGILDEMLEWAQNLGLSYTTGVIKKWAYVSYERTKRNACHGVSLDSLLLALCFRPACSLCRCHLPTACC